MAVDLKNICATKCFGIDGYRASCCSLEDRNYIIGPIDKESQDRVLNHVKDKTWDEVFVNYWEGKEMFPDREIWQQESSYPALRPKDNEIKSCTFYDDENSVCSIYDHRPNVCKNYFCPYVEELMKEEKPKDKIAVFYQFAQFDSKWKTDFYDVVMEKIKSSGLYDQMEFVDFFIKGNEQVELPDKVNNVFQFGTLNEKFKEVAIFWPSKVWEWCQDNRDYKILMIHDIGVGNNPAWTSAIKRRKHYYREYLEYFNIERWKEAVELLDYYDCVGVDWIDKALFRDIDENPEHGPFDLPHYQGGPFYWANADYFANLDINFLKQDVPWKPYLGELFIGNGNPNYFTFYNSGTNHYYDDFEYDKEAIVQSSIDHLNIKKLTESKPIYNKTPKKSKILLTTMFKNESKSIQRMLESWYEHIDYWIFQDNGSTDGTPEIVDNFFADKNIPGFVYRVEEGWKGFGWNRDHLFNKVWETDHDCDWIVKYDCDEYLEVDDDFDWDEFNKDTDAFTLPGTRYNVLYYKDMIFNANLHWRFNHDEAHETVYVEGREGNIENYTTHYLPKTIRTMGTDDGESYTVWTKWISDSLKLEEKLLREETLLEDWYHFWYIGKSYYDASCESEDRYPLGDAHTREFIRRCIFYFTQWIEYKNIDEHDEMVYYAHACLGKCYRLLGEWKNSEDILNKAERYAPRRNFHILELMNLYESIEDYDKMVEQTSRLVDPERTCPYPNNVFILSTTNYIDTSNGNVESLHQRALNLQSNADNKSKNVIINSSYDKRIFVVDNFYKNPHQVREEALQMEFIDDLDWYKGRRTKEQIIYPNTKETFEEIIGQEITNWSEEYGMCGVFQSCNAEDALVYHFDEQQYAGMVYLSPNAPYQSGTTLWAHKETGIRHQYDDSDDACFEGGFFDKTKFEVVDVVGNVFNRLVIFNGKCFHSASEYFGQTIEDSRLFHMFFFD